MVEEAALEMPYTVSPYRGFESLPLRWFGPYPSFKSFVSAIGAMSASTAAADG